MARQRSPLLPIFLIVLVDILGLTLILPLLPFYAEKYGASPFVVGLLAASYAACSLVSGPLLGKLSDRFGRRPLLLVSQAGTLAGFLVMAFAGHLWMVFAGRILDGATAGNLSLAQAYISDVTVPEKRARSFGIIGIAFGIGFLIGPAISGVISQYGYSYPLFVAAALSATSIVCTYTLLPRTLPPQRDGGGAAAGAGAPAGRRLSVLAWGTYVEYFRRPRLGRLMAEFFLFAFSFAAFIGGFALFSERRFTWHGKPFGPREVGYVLAYVGALGIILQGGLLGRLVNRFGEARLVLAGFFSIAVGYALLAFSDTITLLLVSATITSFGNGVLRPGVTSLITQAVGRDEQGVALGLTQSLMSVAQIIAPAMSGLLIEHRLLAHWALAAAAVAAGGVAVSGLGLGATAPAPVGE